MKRRKPPFLLITALVLLVGAAVWFNVPELRDPTAAIVNTGQGHSHDDGHDHSHEEPKPNAGQSSSEKESMKSVLSDATGKGRKPEAPPQDTPQLEPTQAAASGPTQKLPPDMVGKPRPNMQNTATHWWDDTSMMGDKSKKSGR
jgi:ABC-type nickel/cobalt efflux system permease component RcnA